MDQELAYSFQLGSDKNKSKLAKKVALYLFNSINKKIYKKH